MTLFRAKLIALMGNRSLGNVSVASAGGICLGLQGWMATQSVVWQIQHHIPDDAFYYFVLGRNWIVSGKLTFDGSNPASGFHPLWLAFVSGAFFALPAPDAAIQFLIVLCAVLNVITGSLVYFLLRKSFDEPAAALGGILYFVNMPWLIESINGLESALSMLLIVLSLVMSLRLIRSSQSKRWQNSFLLGICFGGMLLARTDLAILMLIIVLVCLVIWRNQWREWLLAGGIGSVFLVAWLFFAWLMFGHIGQSSAYARSVVNWTHDGLVHGMLHGIRMGLQYMVLPYLGFPLIVIISLPIVLLVGLRKWISMSWPICVLIILWGGLVSFVMIHGAIRWNARPWYFLMAPLIGSFSGALLASVNLSLLQNRLRWILLILIIIVQTTGDSGRLWTMRYANQDSWINAAAWVNRNLSANTKIGVFNAGIIGYYSVFPIINLDGLVNDSVLSSLHQHQLYAYLQQMNVDYVIDRNWSVVWDHADFWGVKPISEFLIPQEIIPGGLFEDSPVQVYRVKHGP